MSKSRAYLGSSEVIVHRAGFQSLYILTGIAVITSVMKKPLRYNLIGNYDEDGEGSTERDEVLILLKKLLEVMIFVGFGDSENGQNSCVDENKKGLKLNL